MYILYLVELTPEHHDFFLDALPRSSFSIISTSMQLSSNQVDD